MDSRIVIGIILKPNQNKDDTNAIKALRVLNLDVSSIYDIDIDKLDGSLTKFSDVLVETPLSSLFGVLPNEVSINKVVDYAKLPVYYNRSLEPVNLPSDSNREDSRYAGLLVINEMNNGVKKDKSIYDETIASIVVDTTTLDFCYVMFNSVIYSSNPKRKWDLGDLFWDEDTLASHHLKPKHTMYCDYHISYAELKKYMKSLLGYGSEETLIWNNTCYILPDYNKRALANSFDFNCVLEDGIKDVIFDARSIRQFEIVVPPSVVNFSMLCPRSLNTGGLYKVYMRKDNNINFNLYNMGRSKIINGNEQCDEVRNEIDIEFYG